MQTWDTSVQHKISRRLARRWARAQPGMARQLWPSQDPVGKVFMTDSVQPVTVVAVVGDAEDSLLPHLTARSSPGFRVSFLHETAPTH